MTILDLNKFTGSALNNRLFRNDFTGLTVLLSKDLEEIDRDFGVITIDSLYEENLISNDEYTEITSNNELLDIINNLLENGLLD